MLNFSEYVNKINEGLIKSYDINYSKNYLIDVLDKLNLKYDIETKYNNTISIEIDDFNKIDSTLVKHVLNYILDTTVNLLGYFPSYMKMYNWANDIKTEVFDIDRLLSMYSNISKVYITFESKFDEETEVPNKLYHITIQEYEKSILSKGIIPKSKSKFSKHDYNSRIYVCSSIEDCKKLISKMKYYYTKEKIDIAFNNKHYKKNTDWVLFEIDTECSEIETLYSDPNYLNGYYITDNIDPNCLKITEKE